MPREPPVTIATPGILDKKRKLSRDSAHREGEGDGHPAKEGRAEEEGGEDEKWENGAGQPKSQPARNFLIFVFRAIAKMRFYVCACVALETRS